METSTREEGYSFLKRRLGGVLIGGACLAPCASSQIAVRPPGQTPSLRSAPALDRARQLIAAKQFKASEAILRAYLDTEKASGPGHFLLAYTLFRLHQPNPSLAEYTRAAQIETPSAEDLKNVALDYVLLNDYPDADKWMSRSVETNGRDAEAWYGLGRIRYTRQRFEDAVECFKKALALDPESVKAGDNLGLAYEGLNRTEDAIKAYRAAIALELDSNPASRMPPSEQPLLNLAILLMHHGRPEEALSLLTRAVAIAPQNPRIREQLGHLHMDQGRLPEAQQEFEAGVALAPDRAALHFLLGQVYRREGDNDKAKVQFDRAAALNGSHSTPEKN